MLTLPGQASQVPRTASGMHNLVPTHGCLVRAPTPQGGISGLKLSHGSKRTSLTHLYLIPHPWTHLSRGFLSLPSVLWPTLTPARSPGLTTFQFSSFQSLSRVRLFETPLTAARQASLPIITFQILIKVMSIESLMPSSNRLILCHPLLLLPSIFPTIRVFSKESVLPIKWPESWSFSFSIQYSNEYSGLISFRMDWLDLLAVQGTLKGLLQHYSSKAL